MGFPHKEKAVAKGCCVASSDRITADLTVTLYRVKAGVLDPRFADDVYWVKVVKPRGVGDLIDEEGTLMEDGNFTFESMEQITEGTVLEVAIIGTAELS
jgi:hypothetical protein